MVDMGKIPAPKTDESAADGMVRVSRDHGLLIFATDQNAAVFTADAADGRVAFDGQTRFLMNVFTCCQYQFEGQEYNGALGLSNGNVLWKPGMDAEKPMMAFFFGLNLGRKCGGYSFSRSLTGEITFQGNRSNSGATEPINGRNPFICKVLGAFSMKFH